jgi:hypothetical protein
VEILRHELRYYGYSCRGPGTAGFGICFLVEGILHLLILLGSHVW